MKAAGNVGLLHGTVKAAPVAITLNGLALQVPAGQTLLQAAQAMGVEVPHLCWSAGLAPAGNCRACMVEVEGERVLAAACCRLASPGLRVFTDSPRARAAQRLVLELLQGDMPVGNLKPDNELQHWATHRSVGTLARQTELVQADADPAAAPRLAVPHFAAPRFPARPRVAADRSHAAISVNMDACIQCTRCVRACREEQGNDVIGLAGRGEQARIVFDLEDPLGDSTCVACGECVQACPTGALAPALKQAAQIADRRVDSLCPYCGVGCQLAYHVSAEKILWVDGRQGPANEGRLCVKGRYGFDYINHPQRLTVPLVRRAGAAKNPALVGDPVAARAQFREATWDEALALAGGTLKHLRDTRGPASLAGFGSAKGSNEEAYLFQKLVRLGFGNNNVDHCTRLCHASSVAALLEGLGSGAVSNPVRDVAQAEVIFLIGANPVVNHPVAASWIKNAVAAGTQLIIADPRRSELARHAQVHLQFRPETDVALLNAMLHVIVNEDLVDHAFVAARTTGFEALAEHVQPFSPERMEPVTGIAATTVRDVARRYAKSRASIILWGMGISQHVHGTDNARCLIALALMTGQIGRPGTGLHPLRGQNNVQGASDAGLIPMMLPDYQPVRDDAARARAAAVWGVPHERLSAQPGLTVVEVIDAIDAGTVKGMFIMGENPAMSDPDVHHVRHALSQLDMLVVQDLFLTETATLADVVLPASALTEKCGSFTNTDRTVQPAQRVVPLPGQARQDLWILSAMAAQLGLDWSAYGATALDCDAAAATVFDEMRSLIPSIQGMRWPRLLQEGAITYPCEHEGDPGTSVVFQQSFPTADGRARFVPADLTQALEQPDAEFPLVLITGRQLEHWHTGSMTRRSQALDAIEPDPVVWIHPQELAALGVAAGELLTLHTRRGQVSLYARADEGTPAGTVFVAFCWVEAAVNQLTHAALDPVAKIPGFKFCAVRASAGGVAPRPAPFRSALAATVV